MPVPSPLGAPSAETDERFARRLAYEAGQLLLAVRALGTERNAAQLRATGDRLSHELLMAAIAAGRPGDAVLSEEGRADEGRGGTSRLSADRVWIVDPLDGTREYAEAGRDDWAVHVALWNRTDPDGAPAVGAISLPARGVVLGSDSGLACPRGIPAGPIRVAVSRTRPPDMLERLAEVVDLELVPMGSAGVKIASVLLDEADAYLHAGGQYEWDSAAPVAVAAAAGAHASRLDGSPLRYNNTDPYLPDLLVCRPELASRLLEGIRAVS